MIRRTIRSARNRRATDPIKVNVGSFMVPTLSIVATKLRVTLDRQYVFSAIPPIIVSGGTHGAGELPTALTQVSPVAFDLTYPTVVIATNVVQIPELADGIRDSSGGYMKSGNTTLA
jgi:hypothetical protein